MARNRILILGASGFIGTACAQAFSDSGDEVCRVGRRAATGSNAFYQLCQFDADSLRRVVSEFRPNLCLNAAGASHPAASVQDPCADFEANTILVQHALEALRQEAPSCRYIGISSAAIYGDNPELPWREEAQPCPRSPYGYHKLCAELLAEEYHRLYGLGTLTFRAFSVYGPGLRKQLFWDLFQRSRHAADLPLFGSGRETRDFIYIDEVVAGMMQLAEQASFAGEVLNLGSGHATTIADACEGLLGELGWRGTHYFTGEEIPGSPWRMEADMTRSFALGFRPKIELAEGLKRTAAWLRKTNANP